MDVETQARRLAGIAGLVGAGTALGVGELIAGLIGAVPSPLAAVGGVIVDWSPPLVKDLAISLFGAADKGALALGTATIALVIGWFAGVAGRTRWWVAAVVFATFGLLGALAGLGEPGAGAWAVAASTLVSVSAGLGMLRMLLGIAETRASSDADVGEAGRRRFLVAAIAGAAAAVVAGVVGRRLLASVPDTPDVALAEADDPRQPPGPENVLGIAGLTPLVVPNDEFFRIDTALVIPRVDVDDWRLRVGGRVARELTLSYDDLLARDLIERYVTLACVSNEVGGHLVGNASWRGVRLAEILDEAGADRDGTQIVGRSVDGFTVGFPAEIAFDGRDAMVAVGMNGTVLPARHGFPARLVVPGLYGYVSATKWLSEIEVTGWDDFDAYWVPRGWAKEAPIKTQSRIDVPRTGAEVPAGPVTIAGVAWAPNRGVEGVEVRIDGGPWIAAEAAAPLSTDAWVQWRAVVEVSEGDHTIEVRATDGTGTPQTEHRAPPRPDGATGWHGVRVRAVAPG
jgi:DMSO/TMAO reductase YedYZ molybdopterin-dependent catalytic subunit